MCRFESCQGHREIKEEVIMNSVFKYNGNEICFQTEAGSVMVNATEMAKAFGKVPYEWLRLPETKRFLEALFNSGKSLFEDDAIKTVRGGTNAGTWLHEDVALEFARWLSPAFAIWCNDRIKELLKYGMTATPEALERMITSPELVIGLATALKEERERVKILSDDVVKLGAKTLEQEKVIADQAPKVLFADTVSASSNSILIGELAKLICQRGYEIGQNRMFKWMRLNGYLLSRPGEYYNRPAQRYIEQGLFELKKTSIARGDGTILVSTTPKVTGKGQLYFVEKFLSSVIVRDKEMLKNVNPEKIPA